MEIGENSGGKDSCVGSVVQVGFRVGPGAGEAVLIAICGKFGKQVGAGEEWVLIGCCVETRCD
jgi:hypothetical protein